MGRGKGRKPLPNNVCKMTPDFRGRLVLGRISHQYLQDGGTCSSTRRGIVVSFHATFSNEAKQSGRTICFKCFEEDGVVNFFLEGTGLIQHFVQCIVLTLFSTVRNAKQFFRIVTARIVERLGRLRLQSVSILFCKEAKMIYNTQLKP